MQHVVERLKASKVRAENEEQQKGFTDGECWAKDQAEVRELERLAAFVACGAWPDFFAGESAFTHGDRLAIAVAEISEVMRNKRGDA